MCFHPLTNLQSGFFFSTSTVADSYRQINVTYGNRTVLEEGYYYLNNFNNILSSFGKFVLFCSLSPNLIKKHETKNASVHVGPFQLPHFFTGCQPTLVPSQDVNLSNQIQKTYFHILNEKKRITAFYASVLQASCRFH